jgi:hypothetical protein
MRSIFVRRDHTIGRIKCCPQIATGRITNGLMAPFPRIARLLALAIRFDRLLRAEQFRDYAELARLGRVTRARITQIMKLLDLAPDIQEQILFLPKLKGLNERNLRPIVSRIDWNEQRPMFQKIINRLDGLANWPGLRHD